MADEIIIETTSTQVIEVSSPGPQGPVGAAGTGLETLTSKGDTLYRGDTTGERLPIGTTGQILRVSASGIPEWGAAPASGVSSVSGKTGAVSLDSTDIFTEQALQISDAGTADCNGVFIYGGLFNGRPTYYATKDTFVYWDGLNWVINHNGGDQYFGTATTYAWQAVWSLGAGANPLPVVAQAASHEFEQVVGQRTNPTARGDAAGKNVGTGANDVAAGNHTHTAATQSVAGFFSAADKTKLDGIIASTATPSALGTAAAGTSSNFARADHVHAMPNASALLSTGAGEGDLPVAQGDGTVAWQNGTTWAALNITAADVGAATTTHAASHASAGSDPVTLDPSQVVSVSGFGIWGGGESLVDVVYNIPSSTQPLGLDGGGLGTNASALDGLVKITGGATSAVGIGTGSTEVAAGDHTHELDELDATGATLGHVLTADGSNGASWQAASGGGVTGAASSASDVLGVSGANITGVDANADRIVFWDDSASALKYLEAGSGLSISGTTLTATATGTIGGSTGATDNAVLRADGTGGSTSQGSAFVIADNATASPNNTVNHASIQATGDTTNVSVSIVPKGTGAFMLRVPDSASTGGNSRGVNAVDLMLERTAANQVASGEASFAAGARHIVSGTRAAAVGGYGSTASGTNAVTLGALNTATGETAGSLCGYFNDATASEAVVVGGNSNDATAARSSVIGGNNNIASADSSICVGGQRATANRFCIHAHAAGQFAAGGDAQRIRAVLRCKTTTNAAVEMALDGSTTYLTIPSGKVIYAEIRVVGTKSDGSAVACFTRQYAAKNVAGTSSEVFAPVTIGTDTAAGTSLEVAAVDAGDYIQIRPTGIASETWRWVASVDAVEVAYGT